MTDLISRICDHVMVAVVKSGALDHDDDRQIDLAVRVMRDEIKALVVGDRYARTREAVVAGQVSARSATDLVVANCVERIQTEG